MANTLKAQIDYVAVPAGGTATLPHMLQLAGTSFAPDCVSFENPEFDYVSSTATTLTVINNGLAPASCRVLVELWHTIERVFGNGSPALPNKPFISRGVDRGGGSGGVPDQVFTYVCTGAEGSDFFIPLPAARPDDDYVPQVTCGGVAEILTFDVPDLVALDRTTTQFRVVASSAVQLGDQLDVTVQQRTA